MSTFGILVGGGPAPGINGVIGAVATRALRRGHRALGILDGFQWIMQGRTDRVRELDEEGVEQIHLQGGSILRTSRANPTKEPAHLANVVKSLDALGIEYLVSIGGDDTASSANRVARAADGRIRVVHVPKTIDNDLPLPHGIPTFGFETAREHGTTVVERIAMDMQTTNRWFFIVVMGRSAGHLALGAGKAAGAPVIVIPEEFPRRPIQLEDVVRVLEGAIVKRLARGRPDGVAVIAEGIMEYFDENDPILAEVPRDEHGHIRLAEVPIARVLRSAVSGALASRGVKVTIGEKDVGYELRCGYPSAFDRDYTRDLGVGAVDTLLDGQSSCLITRQEGRIVPIPFLEIIDPQTNKSRVRGVDVASDSYRSALALQERITAEDLADPERLAAIAAAAQLSPEEAKRRYAPH
ncbi:MAG: 6-phosphofructokinase [Myxococcales bacterium]|nr:6-phosphofructokinase [Myxococcales bacterium]MDH5306523.1 6-phosphofructokinase [Myxococcales bacterium]MDH5566164.1 6-phosphofructokinase [Myxococcales bacterium]